MKPVVTDATTPRSLADFAIDWAALVEFVTPVASETLPYLAAIAAGSNVGRASELLAGTVGVDLERLVAFQCAARWGERFDHGSVVDRTFLLLDRGVRRGWLFAISDSD